MRDTTDSIRVDPEHKPVSKSENLTSTKVSGQEKPQHNTLFARDTNPSANITDREINLQAIVNAIQVGIIIIDPEDHRIMDVNAIAVDMIGYPREEIVGRTCHKFICPAEKEKCPITDLKQIVDRSERKLITSDGTELPIFKTVKEFQINGKTFLIESIIDISERKKMEEQIRRMNEELELRVSLRTKELEKTNGILKESVAELNKVQDQLIEKEKLATLGNLVAGIAHEVNTPIGISITASTQLVEKVAASIKLFQSQLLKKSDLEKFFSQASELTDILQSNLVRASNLIKSFKQVSVDQNSEEQRRFNLKEYINEILTSLKPKYKKTNHTIKVSCPDDIFLKSYAGIFSQIFTNLIMNSLIHGFGEMENGVITINVQQKNNSLLINYSDNGRGMDKNEQKNLYSPFFTTKRGSGGSGLGMHIIYTLVTKKLHGTIICTTSPGNGTQFMITIPLSA